MPRRALSLREGHAPVRERLLTTLFLAALVHGLVIVGLTFNAAAHEKDGAPGLEVLLVSDELPESDRNESATYLSQRTQLGSGNTRDAVAAHNRPSALPQPQHEGSPEGDSLAHEGDMAGSSQERVLTTTGWSTQVRYLAADTGTTGTVQERPLLVQAAPTAQPGPEDDPDPAQLRGPKREELWLTPDTESSTVAPYLDRWRGKVERIGTINFPRAARTTGANANPLLEVAISADGNIVNVVVRRSSGDAELDQAALATLKLASPFDPFPPEMAANYRVLHFEYEWQFSGGRFTGGTVTTAP
jgi:periplasmic protein TonB